MSPVFYWNEVELLERLTKEKTCKEVELLERTQQRIKLKQLKVIVSSLCHTLKEFHYLILGKYVRKALVLIAQRNREGL
jgi:hypothetical protein